MLGMSHTWILGGILGYLDTKRKQILIRGLKIIMLMFESKDGGVVDDGLFCN